MRRNLWIALDAAGTLFEPAQPVAQVYSSCFGEHGHIASEAEWNKAFATAFSQTPDPIYPAPSDGDDVELAWWKAVVSNSAKATGFDLDNPSFDKIFTELFSHYASGSAWKLFPETKAVLSDFRQLGVKMAVASNFDSRLQLVLNELGVSDYFDIILTSADVGARKPDPAIALKILELSATNPTDCCLAGDSIKADGGTANASGIEFFHVDRPNLNLIDFKDWHASRFFQ